jgi:3-oxoacyl-[acyl-carrier-protein] synthase III
MNIKNNNIKRGQNILLIGTGAGLSAACAIINY